MPSLGSDQDRRYVNLLIGRLRAIKNYQPKLGQGRDVDLDTFGQIYGADPLYHWVGFDSPLMYAAHKAAGSMTSLYRNLGTGCEHLFQQILKDQLGLDDDDIRWSYTVSPAALDSFEGVDRIPFDPGDAAEVSGVAEDVVENVNAGNSPRKGKVNTLDGRFDLASIGNIERRDAAADWLARLCATHGIEWNPLGAVFEVRQGYKSMDSKRQAADIANAVQALSKARMPVLVVMSRQIDPILITRYNASGWGLLRGVLNESDSLISTFAFFDQVLGYDLVSFFERNHDTIRAEVDGILRSILEVR